MLRARFNEKAKGGMLRFLGWLFGVIFMVALGLSAAALYVIYDVSKDLPDYKQLASWEPPVMTRMHAADGSLLAEYAEERRLYVPVNLIPARVINAYVAAEDKNFYTHAGLDWRGIGKALLRFVQVKVTGHGQVLGASTITQQVAKNFLLSNERTWSRKLKEALVVQRIEASFSKDQIMELYLNDIFLGFNSYGVAAASLNYFGKPLDELTIEEAAYLGALPKGPNNYNPFTNYDRAFERRNYVLQQMFENKYITDVELKEALAKPLKVNPRPFGAQLFSAESFAEEARRELVAKYGKTTLDKGGYSVRTTLDPKLQLFARQAVARGLIGFDRKRGFRGAVDNAVVDGGDWAKNLLRYHVPADEAPWRIAIVTEMTDQAATIGLQPKFKQDGRFEDKRETGLIPLQLMQWAKKYVDGDKLGPDIKKPSDVLALGDIVYVAPSGKDNEFHLVQVPEVAGAMVAMDPHTGRVLAMVGGFSYGASQFNRAVQAMRQPGSSFKPVVYAAALDNGYSPASVVLDAPVEYKLPNGDIWKPKNYEKDFFGPSTLRRGIEQSRNTMTVRLADAMGITKVADLAERLGIYDHMPHQLSMALGAGETSLLKMTTAYSMIANGGKKVEATLIDRIQDRFGRTIFRHDMRDCTACKVDHYTQGMAEPDLVDTRETVMNSYTAYQITSMMEGVVERGTGKKVQVVGKPVAGKTGTSNDEKDAWFIGFTPDLAVGVYVGFDNPKPMGKRRTGGELAAPVVADFMRLALRDKAAVPFRVPRGIELIPIHVNTGKRGVYGEDGVILESFKPGDEPPSNNVVIGSGTGKPAVPAHSGEGVVLVPATKPAQSDTTPAQDGGLTNGGGGLY
jgi:penicillin-binding protein 1A